LEDNDFVKIIINNFEKHNPPTSKGRCWWFKFANDFFDDDKISLLNSIEKLVWVFFICRASKGTPRGTFLLSRKLIRTHVPEAEKDLIRTLKKFKSLQIVTIKSDLNRYLSGSGIGTADKIREDKIREDKIREDKIIGEQEIPATPYEGTPRTNEMVATFCQHWKLRYGENYRIQQKEISALKRLFKDCGSMTMLDRICKAYLGMNDSWFLNKRHDVITLESNFAKVSLYEQNQKSLSQAEIKSLDRREAAASLLQRVKDGEI